MKLRSLALGWFVAVTSLDGCSSKPAVDPNHEHGGAGGASATTIGSPGASGAGNTALGSSGSSVAGSSSGGGIDLGLGGNANTAGTSDGTSCGETALVATRRQVNVLVLLDRSLSMTEAISPADPTTRWESMRNALATAMTKVSDHVAFGLKVFPDADASSECGVLSRVPEVEIGLGSASISAIDQAITKAIPNGGTPITAALDWAAQYFATGQGSQLVGDRVILLATDGAPNCNEQATCDAASCITNIDHPEFTDNLCTGFPSKCLDSLNAKAKVAAILGQPIPVRTVVVGIPGSDKPAYSTILDSLGSVGGLPNPAQNLDYYAVNAEQGAVGLSETLVQITTQLIVTCKLELTSQPPDPTLLNVYVDGRVVPLNATDGWSLDLSTTPPTVLLKGATCSALESKGAQSLSVKYGCPSFVLL